MAVVGTSRSMEQLAVSHARWTADSDLDNRCLAVDTRRQGRKVGLRQPYQSRLMLSQPFRLTCFSRQVSPAGEIRDLCGCFRGKRSLLNPKPPLRLGRLCRLPCASRLKERNGKLGFASNSPSLIPLSACDARLRRRGWNNAALR